MKCYLCGESMRVRSANRKKVGGAWMHKMCPVETARRKERRNEKKNREAGIPNN